MSITELVLLNQLLLAGAQQAEIVSNGFCTDNMFKSFNFGTISTKLQKCKYCLNNFKVGFITAIVQLN